MIFERILVALDGSRLAEASLPVATALAQRLPATLVLVHVLERDAEETVHGEHHLTDPDEAHEYLGRQREACATLGIDAETYVDIREADDVADAIEDLAQTHRADVVAICAHGRRTLRDRLIGPIAQRALRQGTTPVLLRTAGSDPAAAWVPRRILVGVDFRHTLGPALDAVTTLARDFDAAVTLLYAVEAANPLQARLLPGSSAMLHRLETRRARRHLHTLARRLRQLGIEAGAVTARGPAEDALLHQAGTVGADLIVLVTHGRVGLSAWYEHSVMQRMIGQPGLTLLLVRDPNEHDDTSDPTPGEEEADENT